MDLSHKWTSELKSSSVFAKILGGFTVSGPNSSLPKHPLLHTQIYSLLFAANILSLDEYEKEKQLPMPSAIDSSCASQLLGVLSIEAAINVNVPCLLIFHKKPSHAIFIPDHSILFIILSINRKTVIFH